MKSIHLIVLLLIAIFTYGRLLADIDPNSASCIIDSEFSNTEHGVAPLNVWALAGSHAEIDSVFTIDVTAIPDTFLILNTSIPIPNAQNGDGFDNSEVFEHLITWIISNVGSVNVHTRILIPPGVYNFSDQIVMHSNISLKGAGSDLTELRFLIQSDPTSGTMTQDDCRKDAIRINGSGELPHQRIHSVGIEEVPEAVRDARANAEQNGIANARFITGKTEQLLAKAMQDFPADAIVLDPPRAGVEESALWAIRSANIHEILYLSCSPMSLARDLKILLTDGKYELASIAAFDMFPNTWHIECLAHLRLSK